jgi:thiol:disulfide interchange protein DsbC
MLRLAALALCLAALPAAANEAQIRKVLEKKLGAVRIEGVAPAPVSGLWEVRYRTPNGVRVVYTDAAANHVIQGTIYDLQNDRDLTDERLRKLNAIRFDSLPLDLAVKVTRGSGKRVLAMFSDPYCPACRQFEGVLAQLEDVTVYVFMYPVIRPENADHSRAVWCSPDRSKAWLELAAAPQPKVPDAGAACPNPVDKVLALGRRLAVNSTPTLFLANGERLNGGLAARELRELLDQVAAAAPATER